MIWDGIITPMIPLLMIDPSGQYVSQKINEVLAQNNLRLSHPNLLWLEESRLGIAEARKIKNHLSLKPYQGNCQAVVIQNADILTPEAQNALLKALEELPEEALLIMTAKKEESFLPTVLSRCQVISLDQPSQNPDQDLLSDIKSLLTDNYEKRFEYISKLSQKEEFLNTLILFFRSKLLANPTLESKSFLKELTRAEKWFSQNINQRAVLEYLMLKMPQGERS